MHSRKLPRTTLCGMLIAIATFILSGCEESGSGNNEGIRKSEMGSKPVASRLSSPAARFTYEVDVGNDTISVHRVDAVIEQYGGSGSAEHKSSSRSVTVHPSGKFAYVANDISDQVFTYAIDERTGQLTRVGQPVATGLTPRSITIHPSGRFAYVANFNSGDISAYTVDALTGVPIPAGPPVVAGANPVSISIDPGGSMAYITNFHLADESVFAIDPATGNLTALGTTRAQGGGSPFPAGATTGSH
jgi:6-phosphogluconolactonase (cycloisomerase 2 family)